MTQKLDKKRCKYCGKYFEPRRKTIRYCSQECSDLFHRDFYLNKRKLLSGRKPVEFITCGICGKEFEKKSPTHLFCSDDCKRAAQRKRYHDRRAHGGATYAKSSILRGKKFETITCNRCGKLFRSWDRTKNRRCAQCQADVENQYSGVDVSLLERIR